MTRYRTGVFLALALCMASPAALAQGSSNPAVPAVGDELGTTLVSVLNTLVEAGYDVREIERDGDEIEVDILLNGRWYDIDVSRQTGLIVDVDDDNDD